MSLHNLYNVTETHDGPEPRVMRHEVREVLRRVIRPDDDNGESVTTVADRAKLSNRTVYRALAADQFDEETGEPVNESLALDIADRLCRACGTHMALAGCRLKWSTGEVTPYVSLRGMTLRPVK